jgi:hypothetical protein
MTQNKAKRVWNLIDMFFERKLDEREKNQPLIQRQTRIQKMERDEMDAMIDASNDSATQFSLMTAMLAQAEVEVSELRGELEESIALEKTTEAGPKLDAVKDSSQRLAVSLTRASTRLAQLKEKINTAENLTDRGKAAIYEQAAEMTDNLFNDKLDLIEANFNTIHGLMNDAMRRQIDILNDGQDFSKKRSDIHQEVVGDSAAKANETEILTTLLDKQNAGRRAAAKAIDSDAEALLADLRGENK